MRGLLLASAVLLIADGRGWQAAAAQTVAAERRPATPRTVWGDPDLHGLWNVARDDGDAVDLEFAATTDESNLEDQLALLSEQVAGSPGRGRGLPAAATPLRVVRPPPAVPRYGRGHGPRRTARLPVSGTAGCCRRPLPASKEQPPSGLCWAPGSGPAGLSTRSEADRKEERILKSSRHPRARPRPLLPQSTPSLSDRRHRAEAGRGAAAIPAVRPDRAPGSASPSPR